MSSSTCRFGRPRGGESISVVLQPIPEERKKRFIAGRIILDIYTLTYIHEFNVFNS
jgi:hypothetical protein